MARARSTDRTIRIEGLDDFRKELKAIDKALPKEMGRINKKFSEVIASQAQAKAAAMGGVAAHVAAGIKASGRAGGVYVGLSSSAAPAIFGAEFGGGKYGAGNPTPAGGHTTQFGPHRGRDGGALYETIRAQGVHFREDYEKALDELTRRAFPK